MLKSVLMVFGQTDEMSFYVLEALCYIWWKKDRVQVGLLKEANMFAIENELNRLIDKKCGRKWNIGDYPSGEERNLVLQLENRVGH